MPLIQAPTNNSVDHLNYPCSRCAGTGVLVQFSGVMGGTCFKCHGSGRQADKPKRKSTRWSVFGDDRNTGERVCLYNIDSTYAEGAIQKARKTFEGASAQFRDSCSLANATAMPAALTARNQGACQDAPYWLLAHSN